MNSTEAMFSLMAQNPQHMHYAFFAANKMPKKYDQQYSDYESRLRAVREKMKYGDQQSAADLTGLSSDYVKKVCGGSRMNVQILEALESIIAHRETFKKHRKNLHTERQLKKSA